MSEDQDLAGRLGDFDRLVDRMVQALRRRRRRDVPLFETALEVFEEHMEVILAEGYLEIFAELGYSAVAQEGAVEKFLVPDAMACIDRNESYDVAVLSASTVGKLAFLGFMAEGAEVLMAGEDAGAAEA